jgi:hypothetical protein
VLSLQNPSREKKLNHLRVGVSLLLRDGVGVDIERDPAVCMPQQILRHFDVRSDGTKQSSKGVAEVVPSDDLAFNTGADERGSNVLLQQAIGAQWFSSIEPDRRKQKVAILFVKRLALPVEQSFEDQGMKWNRATRAFRLRVSEPVAHARFGDAHLHCLNVDIGPNQSHQFGPAYTSASNQ